MIQWSKTSYIKQISVRDWNQITFFMIKDWFNLIQVENYSRLTTVDLRSAQFLSKLNPLSSEQKYTDTDNLSRNSITLWTWINYMKLFTHWTAD